MRAALLKTLYFSLSLSLSGLVHRSTGLLSRCLLQSSHIPHNETDLSYNFVTVQVLRQQVRAVSVFLSETGDTGDRAIEQFRVQRTALGENSVEIVVIIISK